jgi:hypothetical protein
VKYLVLIDLFIVFNATFSHISAISGLPVLVVEEAGVPTSLSPIRRGFAADYVDYKKGALD